MLSPPVTNVDAPPVSVDEPHYVNDGGPVDPHAMPSAPVGLPDEDGDADYKMPVIRKASRPASVSESMPKEAEDEDYELPTKRQLRPEMPAPTQALEAEDEYAVPSIKKDRPVKQPVDDSSDEYTDMKRLSIIKVLRKRKIDYANKTIDEIRQLARDSDTTSASVDDVAPPPPERSASRKEPPSRSASKGSKKGSKRDKKSEKARESALALLTPFQRELAVEGVNWYVRHKAMPAVRVQITTLALPCIV